MLALTFKASQRPLQQELMMQESRRSLFRSIAGALAVFSIAVSSAHGQDPFPKPPSPLHPGDDEPLPNPNAKSPTKVRLEENQKDIKKDIEKLFDLASQLKQQVEKTDATAVLSLAMVKKAEEIERLARQIKERAKG
jgi:peptidoglycan hydrolase CwlO-like protein